MSKDFDNTNSGALFKNNRKKTEKHPDYTGSINVGGRDYWLSAWLKKSKKDGKPFMSVSVQQKDGEAPPFRANEAAPAPVRNALDDEMPF